MIAIIDYGVGNLFSLGASFNKIGADTVVSSDPDVIRSADRVVLPGVGAYEDAINKLKSTKLDIVVKEIAASGKPLLGICLGMQLMFDRSYEFGVHDGLGILKGQVVGMKDTIPDDLKIPHIGWNTLHIKRNVPLFKYVNDGDHVYFVHSFYAVDCEDSLIATTDYGREMTAAVSRNNVMGCQFHPEKSGEVGLNILRAFIEI